MQMLLAKTDYVSVCFMYYDNDFRSLEIYKKFRFKGVLFGVYASPFLLSAAIKKHIIV